MIDRPVSGSDSGRQRPEYFSRAVDQWAYRHRYLDDWKEKDIQAAVIFRRCFEKALAVYFCREDSAAILFEE